MYKGATSDDFGVENDDDDEFLPPCAHLRGSSSVYNIERFSSVARRLCWIIFLIFVLTLDGVAGFSGASSVARAPLSSSSLKRLTYKCFFSTKKNGTSTRRDDLWTLKMMPSAINLVDAAFDSFHALPTGSGGKVNSKQFLGEIQVRSTIITS